MDKKVLSINGLMKHMRDKHNINIGGTPDKVKLRNIGYFHGYKGYRFIKNTSNKLTFNNFDERGNSLTHINRETKFLSNLQDIAFKHFNEAFKNRLFLNLENFKVPYIDFENLMKNKMATGRLKDLLDIEQLKKKNK